MKKSSGGGINPTNPTTELNLWSCNLGGGILGYAQFPGGSTDTDGVVIDNNAFGRTGTVTAPYNKGRTATHEVGHWRTYATFGAMQPAVAILLMIPLLTMLPILAANLSSLKHLHRRAC